MQGWLLAPANFDARRKYPMIVWIHGGPASASLARWPDARAALLLARSGYFVFFPNPRGSYGQGEAFTRANVKDFGYGDLRDILAGVDAVVQDSAGRHQPPRHLGLELRRLHDDVGGDADARASRPRWPAPASPTGRATTARTTSTSG